MLHLGTLVALLVYFWADWLRLVPAGLAAIRDRSFRGDPGPPPGLAPRGRDDPGRDRRASCSTTSSRSNVREVGLVAADARRRRRDPVARRPAWRPGQGRRPTSRSRSPSASASRRRSPSSPGSAGPGISISAALFAGLDREAAARFSFLMATPITAGAGGLRGPQARRPARPASTSASSRSSSGMVAAFVLGHARDRRPAALPADPLADVFVVYRLVLAGVVLVAWLAR